MAKRQRYEEAEAEMESTGTATPPPGAKIHKLPPGVPVRMFCPDLRVEVGVPGEDDATIVYKSNNEGVIEVKPEHVEALMERGWAVVE